MGMGRLLGAMGADGEAASTELLRAGGGVGAAVEPRGPQGAPPAAIARPSPGGVTAGPGGLPRERLRERSGNTEVCAAGCGSWRHAEERPLGPAGLPGAGRRGGGGAAAPAALEVVGRGGRCGSCFIAL